jgi:hypothetical protein
MDVSASFKSELPALVTSGGGTAEGMSQRVILLSAMLTAVSTSRDLVDNTCTPQCNSSICYPPQGAPTCTICLPPSPPQSCGTLCYAPPPPPTCSICGCSTLCYPPPPPPCSLCYPPAPPSCSICYPPSALCLICNPRPTCDLCNMPARPTCGASPPSLPSPQPPAIPPPATPPPPSPRPPPVPAWPPLVVPPIAAAPPGQQVEAKLEVVMIVAGTVASFDAEGFKQSFATALQVALGDITLRVEAASVRVNANVTVAAAGPTAVATATQRVMNSLAVLRADPSAASAMLGVTLESMDPPVLHLTKCTARPASRPSVVPPPLLLSPLQCDSHPAWHWRTFARLACVCAQCSILDDAAKLDAA